MSGPISKAPAKPVIFIEKQSRYGWLFSSFSLVLLLLFMVYPIISSLYMSTFASKGMIQKFVGLSNYVKLLQDSVFLQALQNTMVFFAIQVPVMLFLALVIAALLNDQTLKFRGVFRTGLFLPAVTSLVAYSLLFKMMFATDGLINRSGYNMVFYLSGLQAIPEELYEAAEIDGANKIHQFLQITLPLLKPMVLFTAVMSTIGTLQLFDEPMNFSSAGVTSATIGPGNSLLTMSVYIYNLCFKYMPNFGYAATVAYAIVILIVILSSIQSKLAGERDET
jgi:lactose/L-arabinose transport system permease protein